MAFEPPPDAGTSFRKYFQRPNLFVRMILEKYFGWSVTESISTTAVMSNTESSSKKVQDVEKSVAVEEDSVSDV